ncbi:MAG TPA: hypothetical protein VK157_11405 [Phycisphaerales bacterium]|nr:hypothetical protein [Phycisphaerales bacterium]
MSDTASWYTAVLLVGAGVSTEGYLAWMFIRDWREGRADERARRARWRAGSTPQDRSARSIRVARGTTLAALGMTAAVAAAQTPAPQSVAETQGLPPTIRFVEGSSELMTTATTPTAATSTPDAPAPTSDLAPAPAETVGSAISVQLNLDFTNAYFYRGIRQQDKGLIVQPAARMTTRFIDDAEVQLDGFLGTWNSFGPNGGTQTGGLIEDWYESDLYGGFTLTHGKLSLTTSYTLLTSPSDAFQTVEEIGFTLALDDSEWMKEWALNPYATLVLETGSNGSDGPDLDNGAYLELGIVPGFSFDAGHTPVTLTFPASVGLSLSDYYQDASGSDATFGFAQFGAKASIPLGEPGCLGAWTLNAGVTVLLLNDHTEAFNNGDDTDVIGSVGVQLNF